MSRPATVWLVRHAPTAATRRGAFPADEPLDERGRERAARLVGLQGARAVTAPAQRCRETAGLAGFPDARIDARWAELDFGGWTGRTFQEVWEEDRGPVEGWLADPRVAPPGGESLDELRARVVAALDDLREPATSTVVFTSGGPVKVAVLTALAAPLGSIWNLDVAPGSVTELHARDDGGWTLRSLNASSAAVTHA